jgi:serine/threonine-protein kinase HipA
METSVLVYVDLAGVTHLVGQLWARTRGGRESATFVYSDTWLSSSARFSIDPALPLTSPPFHAPANKSLFGGIGDSAPDRWGRMLMRRAERRRGETASQTARTLQEIDYLLMVDDEARQGALRFAVQPNGPFLAIEPSPIPPLVTLPALLSATEKFIDNSESDEDLRLLLAPGSSLGGARPKASVRDRDGQLAIAKFPHKDDYGNAVLWEAVALTLAEGAGIPIAPWRVENIAGKAVLVLRRFDRTEGIRIPFLSALSMLGANDNERRSYLEFVDILRQHGAAPKQDIQMVWRRMVFNILISNTDDHLRNHGFLYAGGDGWRLAPAYDMIPVPTDIKPRVLTTSIDLNDGTASLELALQVAEYFDVSGAEAHETAYEVAQSVAKWRYTAEQLRLFPAEINRMASAFEHEDLRSALAPENSVSVLPLQ